MSARKWPIYTMEPGAVVVVENPPRCFADKVSKYARETGKKFKTRKIGDAAREVRRVA